MTCTQVRSASKIQRMIQGEKNKKAKQIRNETRRFIEKNNWR